MLDAHMAPPAEINDKPSRPMPQEPHTESVTATAAHRCIGEGVTALPFLLHEPANEGQLLVRLLRKEGCTKADGSHVAATSRGEGEEERACSAARSPCYLYIRICEPMELDACVRASVRVHVPGA